MSEEAAPKARRKKVEREGHPRNSQARLGFRLGVVVVLRDGGSEWALPRKLLVGPETRRPRQLGKFVTRRKVAQSKVGM